MKLYTSIDLAYWFLNKSAGDGETWREMTQMKLQKLVYFAQLVSVMGNGGTPIHSDVTMAWDYGPVAPVLYRVLKQFKGNPLNIAQNEVLRNAFVEKTPTAVEDIDALEVLNSVWEKFRGWSAGKMMLLSHKRGCAWDHVYTRKKYGTITRKDMMKYGFGFGV